MYRRLIGRVEATLARAFSSGMPTTVPCACSGGVGWGEVGWGGGRGGGYTAANARPQGSNGLHSSPNDLAGRRQVHARACEGAGAHVIANTLPAPRPRAHPRAQWHSAHAHTLVHMHTHTSAHTPHSHMRTRNTREQTFGGPRQDDVARGDTGTTFPEAHHCPGLVLDAPGDSVGSHTADRAAESTTYPGCQRPLLSLRLPQVAGGTRQGRHVRSGGSGGCVSQGRTTQARVSPSRDEGGHCTRRQHDCSHLPPAQGPQLRLAAQRSRSDNFRQVPFSPCLPCTRRCSCPGRPSSEAHFRLALGRRTHTLQVWPSVYPVWPSATQSFATRTIHFRKCSAVPLGRRPCWAALC
jgi:hypothetical protein